MKVVILAGGFGTRISEESAFKPKPMIEIGGMPILWHIMKTYSYYGFNEFIICFYRFNAWNFFIISVNSSFVITGLILLDVIGTSIFKDESLIGFNK